MPRYWFTTHWPPLGEKKTALGVYICDGREEAGRDVHAGDMVVIYETGSAPKELVRRPDGTEEWRKRRGGKKGVVAIAKLKEDLHCVASEPERQYSDGSIRRWCWRAEGGIVNVSGFIPRERVAELLGYNRKYSFHGIGRHQSGLLPINEETYSAIVKEFIASRPEEQAPPAKSRFVPPRVGHGEGGEGPIHEALKRAVYTEPSKVLGRAGLKGIEMEFQFETGDRADVVLEDLEGRYITVEVEESVPRGNRVGLLQAIKYKYMYAVKCSRQNEEVLTFLVAHEIDEEVKAICRRYGVEYFEVPRPESARAAGGGGRS